MMVILSILSFGLFIYSVILHEIAHGWVADRLGDPTARLMGRLTLNPIPHIDPIMSILLPLFLRLTGSPVIFGAAKPVPIDPYNLRHPQKEMGIIALAGPVANLSLAIILATLARISLIFFPNLFLIQLLANVVMINLVLALFNLIPLPPLDGGRILIALLPPEQARSFASLERFGILIIFFLLVFPSSFFSLSSILYHITSFIFNLIFPGVPFI